MRIAALTLITALAAAPGAAAAPGPQTTARAGGAEERHQALEKRLAELEAVLARARSGGGGQEAASLAELERRLEILSREIEELRIGEAAVEAGEGVHGFGPAASKIYRTEKGVSLGGYAEMLYEGFDSRRDDGAASGKTDQLDFLRLITYVGYKFSDRILFNSELEFEHASTGKDGEVSVEFAYLDFLFNDRVNARAGLLLVPMGFINELHEPPIFLGARRPQVERALIPTTWRENGVGVFGDLGPVSYRAYLVAGFDGAGLDESGFGASGLRGGRQSGSKSLAEDLGLVARADWSVTPGLTLGASFYTGDSGQGAVAPTSGQTVEARTDILEAHLEWRWRGLEARALWVDVSVDEADLLNDVQGFTGSQSIGEEMQGHYLQAGFDVLAHRATRQALIPFVRFESMDTQRKVPAGFSRNPASDLEVVTYGVSYKPIPNVVLKLDFQNFDNAAGTGVDQWNVAVGLLF